MVSLTPQKTFVPQKNWLLADGDTSCLQQQKKHVRSGQTLTSAAPFLIYRRL